MLIYGTFLSHTVQGNHNGTVVHSEYCRSMVHSDLRITFNFYNGDSVEVQVEQGTYITYGHSSYENTA